ncbi:hypothetical protein DENIS_4121 [Desulfonema ishimotonii]|uniref:Uncharacterized protein n=1 Tax=Desulfonema ishimotonii TaxID=45657 RepID=A0A401G1L3_9BACT|nr:hypothetical protein [Desulfonema ishimotonii]GBC63128.1 hypothetical protein DENIS_4121 [Desulfonema ishimotonii]
MGARLKGKWEVLINYRGQQQRIMVGDKKTAKAVADEIQKKIIPGTWGDEEQEKGMCFKDYVIIWKFSYAGQSWQHPHTGDIGLS